MPSLSITAFLSFIKEKTTFYSDPAFASLKFAGIPITVSGKIIPNQKLPSLSFSVNGKMGVQGTKLVTTSDQSLPLGDIGTIGYAYLRNLSTPLIGTPGAPVITNVVIPTPSTPVVANIGTPGAATVSYKVQAVMGNGDLSPASSAGTTATSNAVIAAAAQDTVAASGTPANNDTVTVNGHVYTFKTTLTGAANEVHINGQDGSLTNLQSAINASGGVAGTDYGTGTVANADVTAGPVASHVITLTAIVPGNPGNSLTLAKSGANLSVGAALFSWSFNRLSWDAVPGAASYNIYRTVSPTTPSTTGLIGSTSSLTYDDIGLAGDSTTAPTFTNSATWTYKIVGRGPAGEHYTVASAAGSTATGRILLTANNYNLLKWLPVEDAVSYDIYRTVSGGTPDKLGFFLNVPAGAGLLVNPADGLTYETCVDNGAFEGDGSSAPSTTPWDFSVIIGSDGTLYPLGLKGQEPLVGRWNAAAIHLKANVNSALLYYLILED
jgi:hypothetical protein